MAIQNASHVIAAVILVAVASAFGGCASLEGYPRDPENTADALARLAPNFDGTREAEYQVASTPEQRQRLRDAIILGRIRAYDLEFDAFARELYGSGNSISVGSDLIVLILAGLGATTGDATTKSALAAASAGVVGAQGAINKDLYYQRTIPAMLAQMEANRAIAKLAILQGLYLSDAQYSLWRAYLDLESLKNAGSIPGAIATITGDAGNAKAAAESAITFDRDAAYKLRLPNIEAIADRLHLLSGPQLVALAQVMQPFLVTRSQKIQQLVQGLDPKDLRLNGNVVRAKQVLSAWIDEDEMTPAQITEWQAALNQVTAMSPVNLLPPVPPVVAIPNPAGPVAPANHAATPTTTIPSAQTCPHAPTTPERSRLFVALGSDETGHKPYNRDRTRLMRQCMGEKGVPPSTLVYDFLNCPVFESKLGPVADCVKDRAKAAGGH